MIPDITIAVVQFPGSNCERETLLAIERAGMKPLPFLWNEDYTKLIACDGYVIVGGFSYEDRSRSGVIASLDPVMTVIKEQSRVGKPVLGICNGAQVLVETGLVPGLERDQLGVALTTNRRVKDGRVVGTGYYNAWVHLKVQNLKTAFSCDLQQDEILKMPVAHGEGRFMMPDAVLAAVRQHQLAVFAYCNDKAEVSADYPINPNGSVDNIAALCNVAGNVMAIMPHPERTAACDGIFKSMRKYILEKQFAVRESLKLHLPAFTLKPYQPQKNSHSFFVELMITDNQAETVRTALKRLGIDAEVKRFVHWEVAMTQDVTDALVSSGELFNERKERYYATLPETADLSLLVRDLDDMRGQQKLQVLTAHFQIPGLQSIKQGVVWQIKTTQLAELKKVETIFFNPHAHEVLFL